MSRVLGDDVISYVYKVITMCSCVLFVHVGWLIIVIVSITVPYKEYFGRARISIHSSYVLCCEDIVDSNCLFLYFIIQWLFQ